MSDLRSALKALADAVFDHLNEGGGPHMALVKAYGAALEALAASDEPHRRGWRETAVALHESGDDEPYATDAREAVK